MAWHLSNSGSAIEIRPGRSDGGHYASFPEARRAALARLDAELAASDDDAQRTALRRRRDAIAAMTASDVPKDSLSTRDGIEMDAAMEMVQLELAREKLARRPILAAFVVGLVAVIALLSLLNG